MSLKRKLLFTTSTLLVAATPIATVISCGGTSINFNINDGINGQKKLIQLTPNDLHIIALEGKNSPEDGKASAKFNQSPNVKLLLKEAGATYESFVKYYWKGSNAKFEQVKMDSSNKLNVKNLRIEDEIKLKIKLHKPGFYLSNNGIIIKKISNSSNGIRINWHEPAISINKKVDNMLTINGDTLNIELDKNVKLNELVFAISKKLGFLFTGDPTRYVSLVMDHNKNPITINDIWQSLENYKNTNIKKIKLHNKATNETALLDLESMDNIILPNESKINITTLISKGASLIKKYKDIALNDKLQAGIGIFTSDNTAQIFAEKYKSVVTNLNTSRRLLGLIGALGITKDDPDKTNKEQALSFIPKLAVGYGNIFQWLIKTKPFTNWLGNDNYLRETEVNNIPNIFMATLFRINPTLD